MKKFVTGLIVGLLLATSIMTFAGVQPIKLIVNGVELESEVPPQIIDGRTMIPARPLAEALGAKVEWDAENSTVVVTGGDIANIIPSVISPVDKWNKNEEENNKMEDNVVKQKDIIETYKKDGYIFTIENGVEWIPVRWIDSQIKSTQYFMGFNSGYKEIAVVYNKYPGRPNDKNEFVLKGIPLKVFNGHSCITKDDYENKVLPIVNKE